MSTSGNRIDANLVASNIKDGVSIFGIAGSYLWDWIAQLDDVLPSQNAELLLSWLVGLRSPSSADTFEADYRMLLDGTNLRYIAIVSVTFPNNNNSNGICYLVKRDMITQALVVYQTIWARPFHDWHEIYRDWNDIHFYSLTTSWDWPNRYMTFNISTLTWSNQSADTGIDVLNNTNMALSFPTADVSAAWFDFNGSWTPAGSPYVTTTESYGWDTYSLWALSMQLTQGWAFILIGTKS